MAALDHLVYATPDLAALVSGFEARSGVRPAPGGAHPGLGTRNELVRLGDGVYLELIGPDGDQPAPAGPRPFSIDDLTAPTLVTWAVRTTRLDEDVAAARAAGHDLGEPAGMSRRRPDGSTISWRLARGRSGRDGSLPFLIDWGSSPHPSESAAVGVELLQLDVEHPDAALVERVLRAIGLGGVTVRGGPVQAVTATLRTPRGLLVLR